MRKCQDQPNQCLQRGTHHQIHEVLFGQMNAFDRLQTQLHTNDVGFFDILLVRCI